MADEKKELGKVITGIIEIQENEIRLASERMKITLTINWNSKKSREVAAENIGSFIKDLFAMALIKRVQ